MNLVVTLEHRFDRAPDGTIWTQGADKYSFWERYLDVFDNVQVVARAREVTSAPPNSQRADGELVSFLHLPCFIGPKQFLMSLREIRRRINASYSKEASFIAHAPSAICTLMLKELNRRGHPYGLEVISDPCDIFAPGVLQHPLRPFFRWWFSRNLARQCANADAASYVTEFALQRRYPCKGFSVGISDVDLPGKAFVDSPRHRANVDADATIVFVGALEQKYKAAHVLIDAVAACSKSGLGLKLLMVGDGRYRTELEARARALGLAENVIFKGQLLAGAQVREQLDKADLFVLPSLTEGLPRAMVEAMARGLPCLGTSVGGIPELLLEEDTVPPGDSIALAEKILEVLSDPRRLSLMSERNLDKARRYSDQLLHDKRIAFYSYVRDFTEMWLAREES